MAIYIVQFTAVWLLFLVVGSLSVEAQVFIYSFWPIYAFLLWRCLVRSLGHSSDPQLLVRDVCVRLR